MQPCVHAAAISAICCQRIAPGRPEDEGIARVHTEADRQPERAQHVQTEQEGDRQAQELLRRFPDRHSEIALAEEPRDREHAMHGEAADEQDHARRAPPDRGEDAPPGLHRLHRRRGRRCGSAGGPRHRRTGRRRSRAGAAGSGGRAWVSNAQRTRRRRQRRHSQRSPRWARRRAGRPAARRAVLPSAR